MSEIETKLTANKATIESNFNSLEQQRLQLVEQRKEMDRRMSAIAEEMVRLQGEFRAVEEILGSNGKGKPDLTIPKKKKKKK